MIRKFVIAIALIALAAPIFAAGPADVEFGVKYWMSDPDLSIGEGRDSSTIDTDASDLAFYGKIWIGKWGVAASRYKTKMEVDTEPLRAPGEASITGTYLAIDIKRKIFSPSETSYLAVGVGFEQIDVEFPGREFFPLDTQGFRLNVEGQVSLAKKIRGFAELSYYISMDDPKFIEEANSDTDGYEFELGAALQIFPHVDLLAGYRASEVEYDFREPGGPGRFTITQEPAGFFVGAAMRF